MAARKTSGRRRAASRPRLGTRRMPRGQRMQEMLEVAARVFAARGYRAASMEEIALAAEISKPLLYRYYGSKEGLYLALVARAGARLADSLGPLREEPDPLRRIERSVAALVGFVARDPQLWRLLSLDAADGVPPTLPAGQALHEQLVSAGARTIAELLGDTSAAGLRAAEPLTLALYGAGEALARWWLAHPEVPESRARALLLGWVLPVLQAQREALAEPA